MVFLQISDLHLGKTLCGYDLLEDQAYVLNELLDLAQKLQPDALLVAGDVYDRAVPPVEAIRLFDSFLMDLRKACPGIRIVVIPGNHDSPGRLSFGASLLADTGLVIQTTVRSRPAVVLDKAGERAALWALPFLSQAKALWPEAAMWDQEAATGPGDQLPEDTGLSLKDAPQEGWQAVLARRAMSHIAPEIDPESLNVLVFHCFAAGGLVGDSEMTMVGAAESIPPSVFDGFDYVALGHLHSYQSPAPNVWYSGAPLAYSLQDADREKNTGHGALVVKLGNGSHPQVDFAPLKPRRRLRRIVGDFASLLANPPRPEECDDYVDITLIDEKPVLDPEWQLRSIYPHNLGIHQLALEYRYAVLGSNGSADFAGSDGLHVRRLNGGMGKVQSADALVRDDFVAFYKEMKAEEPDQATLSLFDALLKEVSEAGDASD